jgi:antirestriction protein ArdC
VLPLCGKPNIAVPRIKHPRLLARSLSLDRGRSSQFATLAHELGHLFLGHLGTDKKLDVKGRSHIKPAQKELEAESLAYLVCARNGVTSKSETYLANYVTKNTTIEHIDLYQILHAAGQVETLLGLAAHAKFDRPKTR